MVAKQPIEYEGSIYDSFEELHFAYWLNELKEEGFITDWSRTCLPISLTDGLYHSFTETKILKTKTKQNEKRQVLLAPSVYTPDFNICWSAKAKGTFFVTLAHDGRIATPFIGKQEADVYSSLVEIKPLFDQNNMTRVFKNNQKFIWDKYKEYVNLIYVTELFEQTFTPKKYRLTPTGKPRKINWNPITLKQFVDDKK